MRYVVTFLWIKEDSLQLNAPVETKTEQIMVTADSEDEAFNSIDRLADNPGSYIPEIKREGYRFANWWVREDPVTVAE